MGVRSPKIHRHFPTQPIEVSRESLRDWQLLCHLHRGTCSTLKCFFLQHTQAYVIDALNRLLLCDHNLKTEEGRHIHVGDFVSLHENNIVEIVCGANHAVALTIEGALYSWGGIDRTTEDEDNNNNNNNNARQGKLERRRGHRHPFKVTRIFEKDIVSVKCGDAHTLALDSKGAVFAWGSNRSGQLATRCKHAREHMKPAQVEVIQHENIVQIAAGRYHSLALNQAGVVYGWGSSRFGQIAHEQVPAFKASMIIPLLPVFVTAIAAGGFNSLFLTRCGKVYVCGYLGFSYGDTLRCVLVDQHIDRIFVCPFAHTERMFLVTRKVDDEDGPDQDRCYVWGDIQGGGYLVKPRPSKLKPSEAMLEYGRQQRFPVMLRPGARNIPLAIKIGRLFNSPIASDVVFVFTKENDQSIRGHRLVLTMVNDYFETMLSDRWCSETIVKITEWKYRLFHVYVGWIYQGGELESPSVSYQDAIELLDMANCVLDENFKLVCWNYLLARHLDRNTACDLLDLSILYQMELKAIEPLKQFIASNYANIKHSKHSLSQDGKHALKQLKPTSLWQKMYDDGKQFLSKHLWPFKRQEESENRWSLTVEDFIHY